MKKMSFQLLIALSLMSPLMAVAGVSCMGFSEGLAPIRVNGKFGFINKSGEWAIKPKYDFANNFADGLAIVEPDGAEGKYGVIDKEGNIVADFKYSQMGDYYSDGLARVMINGKHGFINKLGKLTIPIQFEDATDFAEGLAGVQIKNKWGFINTSGKIVIKPTYAKVRKFSEGLARVTINGKFGFINKSGKILIRPQFSEDSNLNDFHGGLAFIQIDGKSGFINKKGELAIQAIYQDAESFSEGFAVVKINDQYGFINNAGEMVIEPQHSYAIGFREGIAVGISRSNNKTVSFYFNDKKEFLFLIENYNGTFFSDGLTVVDGNNTCHYLNKSGELAISEATITTTLKN